MTTVAQARAALVTAVSAVDAYRAPPQCYVYSNGTDFTGLGGSSVEWSFRVTCAVGWKADDAKASSALGTLVQSKLSTLQASPIYRIQSVSGDVVRQIGGADHLTADIAVSCKVDI